MLVYLHLLSIRLKMEPPSSVNIENGMLAGQQSEDPARAVSVESYFIVSRQGNGNLDEPFVVCAWSVLTGLAYLGTSNHTES